MAKIYEAQQVVERLATFHQHYVARSNHLAHSMLKDSIRWADTWEKDDKDNDSNDNNLT